MHLECFNVRITIVEVFLLNFGMFVITALGELKELHFIAFKVGLIEEVCSFEILAAGSPEKDQMV